MIPKILDQITEADLKALIDAAVAERKTLDYKQQLPTMNDASKRELLADVSSFANTAGGDLIFGMIEAGGLPTAISGVQIGDVDAEVLRFDAIIRDGLSPRIRHATRAVSLSSGGYVLIIRSERSLTDLRNAFLFANTVVEKIAAFRSERIIALENGQALTPLAEGPKLVLHCMALESFGAKPRYDVLALNIQPMYATRLGGYGMRINFEGAICVASGTPPLAYTQVFRNGVIEAVRAGVLNSSRDPDLIPSLAYEEALVSYLPSCFEILKRLGCNPPVLVGITLIGVRGLRMAVGPNVQLSMGRSGAIQRDVIVLPDIVVDDLSSPAAPLLKPVLDLVRNACGYPGSQYFDDAGNWIGRDR